MTTPADEAAAILIRMFETIAYGMGKRLRDDHKTEIRRACELLSSDGTLAPLDELPKATPTLTAASYIEAAQADPKFQEWKKRREER